MRTRWSVLILLILGFVLACSTSAGAAQLPLSVFLTGDKERPTPNDSPAQGLGGFLLNETMDELFFDVTFFNLQTPFAVAHFHVGSADVAGPVVRGILPGEILFLDQTRTLGQFQGTWKSTDAEPLTPALVAQLQAGNIYFNIHTQGFPAGEIRDQLVPVPEPSTGVLYAAGVFCLCALVRRRWRQPA